MNAGGEHTRVPAELASNTRGAKREVRPGNGGHVHLVGEETHSNNSSGNHVQEVVEQSSFDIAEQEQEVTSGEGQELAVERGVLGLWKLGRLALIVWWGKCIFVGLKRV